MFQLILQAAPAGSGSPIGALLPMILIFVLFYFLLIRPQSQRYKKHQAMLSEIVRGDQIVTNGGLIGKVTKATDDDLTIEIAQNVKVKVKRAMIADVLNRTEPANDKK